MAPGLRDMTATEAKRVLEETAPDAWLQIDPARFQKPINSIPRRIAACITAERWYTKTLVSFIAIYHTAIESYYYCYININRHTVVRVTGSVALGEVTLRHTSLELIAPNSRYVT